MLVSSLCGQGALELNPCLPAIGCAIIESINLLISCNNSMFSNMLEGLEINREAGYKSLVYSPSVTTALTPYTGYHKAAELAKLMKEKKIDIFEANEILAVIDREKLRRILQPGNLLKMGFSLEDLV